MAIDPSIALKTEVMDPLNFGKIGQSFVDAKAAKQDRELKDQQLQASKLTIGQTLDKIKKEAGVRNWYATDRKDLQKLATIDAAAYRLEVDRRAAEQKALLEAKRTQAQIDRDTATASKTKRDSNMAQAEAVDGYLSQFAGLTPEQQALSYPEYRAKIARTGASVDNLPEQWDESLRPKIAAAVAGSKQSIAQAKARMDAEEAAAKLPGTKAQTQILVDKAAGQEKVQPADKSRLERDQFIAENTARHQKAMERLGAEANSIRREAAGASKEKLSGEAAKVLGVATTMLPELDKLEALFRDSYKTTVAGKVTGTNREVVRLIDNIADKVGRLRSGGAINKDEEQRFLRQLGATTADLAFGSAEEAIEALRGVRAEAQLVSSKVSPSTAKAPATAGSRPPLSSFEKKK